MYRLYPLEKITCPTVDSSIFNTTYNYNGEDYNVNSTTFTYKGSERKGFVCQSSDYSKTFRWTKPRLLTFYKDLEINNKNYIKFPSWTCNYQQAIEENSSTCQLAIIGKESIAGNATNPPEDMNFYLIMKELRIPFMSGVSLMVVVSIILATIFPIYYIVSIFILKNLCPLDEGDQHYYIFGPFGILLIIYDCLTCSFCKERNFKKYENEKQEIEIYLQS